MTTAPSSRTMTAVRVRAGEVVVPSMGCVQLEAGANRPLLLSGLVHLLALLLVLTRPSSAAPPSTARRMGGLPTAT